MTRCIVYNAECRRLTDFNNYFVGGWGDVERLISKTVQLSSCVVGRSVVQLVPIVQSFSQSSWLTNPKKKVEGKGPKLHK